MTHLAALLAWHDIFNFDNYSQLLPLVRNSIIAGAFLGVVGGVVGVLVMTRDLPFAVHGVSELSFAGASGALLFGASVTGGAFVGSVLAALLIGLLGMRARDRNSIIGVLMPFGLGLGILFLSLYHGRAANKFGLLTGQIVAIDNTALRTLIVTSVAILAVLAVTWRPLMFASVDPVMATARGVPTRLLGLLFMLILGCAVAISIQVVGALLILALLVTPARRSHARQRLPGPRAGAHRPVRPHRRPGRHLRVTRHQHPHQPLRHHHLLPHLPHLPSRRRIPTASAQLIDSSHASCLWPKSRRGVACLSQPHPDLSTAGPAGGSDLPPVDLADMVGVTWVLDRS